MLGVEDPLEVRVYPGVDASFTLYEDDGDTYAYQKGAASRIPLLWDDKARALPSASAPVRIRGCWGRGT